MTKKVKFEWEFICNEKERYLDINLNGGNNKSLYFDHPEYYKFLSDVFKEISFYQFTVGHKTHVYGLEELAEVDAIRKDEPLQVIKQQQLARRGKA